MQNGKYRIAFTVAAPTKVHCIAVYHNHNLESAEASATRLVRTFDNAILSSDMPLSIAHMHNLWHDPSSRCSGPLCTDDLEVVSFITKILTGELAFHSIYVSRDIRIHDTRCPACEQDSGTRRRETSRPFPSNSRSLMDAPPTYNQAQHRNIYIFKGCPRPTLPIINTI